MTDRRSNPSGESCGRCRFWQDRKDGKGMCRRNPPRIVETLLNQPVDSNAIDDATVFPGTFENDWCGEFNLRGSGIPC